MTPQLAVAAVDSAGSGKDLPGAQSQPPSAGGTVAPFSLALGQLQVPLLVEEGTGEAPPKQGSEAQNKLLTTSPDPAAAALAAVLQWLRQSTAAEPSGAVGKPEVGSATTDTTTVSAVGSGATTSAAGGALAMSTLNAGYLKSGDREKFAADGTAATNAAAFKSATLTPDIHSLADLFRLTASETRSTSAVAGSVTGTGEPMPVEGKTALASGVADNAAIGAVAATDMNSTARAGGSCALLQNDRTISVPMHDHHWSQAIAAQVLVLVDHRIESATLHLTPEHLGPVEVRIDMEDSQVNVSFGAVHSDTRAALEQALPRLREVLAGAGLTLGEASVHQQMRGDSHNRGAGARTSSGTADQPLVVMVSIRRMLGFIDEYV